MKWIAVLVCSLALKSNVSAQEKQNLDTTKTLSMPQIQIVIQQDKLLSKVPGAVTLIDAKTIRQIQPITGNEMLRTVTGLNVVDEEGAGLRINIGIRGLDPDRSRNVLILEDGIPVALNPYGEPEMYFTPAIEKMKSIEVLKGSGQILFGPQTTGGVVNLITAHPPEKESTAVTLRAGTGGFASALGSYGNTVGNLGFVVNYLHKRADAIGATRFNIHDISTKFRLALSEKSVLGFKLGFYDEQSNSTYIGLTQTMYDQGGQDYVRMAAHDFLPVRRYNLSATHQYTLSSNIQLQTTGFAYTVSRNWRRQDFSSSSSARDQTGIVWGDESVAGGAVYMQKTNGHRNRQFEVAGVESQLNIQTGNHRFQIGARTLYEKAKEQFIVGNKPDATAGNLRDNEIRSGNALSLYVQDKITVTKKLTLNIGARLEHYQYARNMLRGRFLINGITTVADTNLLARNAITALIPGLGFNYTANENITFFGGIHKGFAPPRTKDAITSEGVTLNIKQEDSWNSELGMRTSIANFLTAEFTLFNMEFNNQIIPISESSGNVNATGLANGGRTSHTGIEMGTAFDLAKCLKKTYSLFVSGNMTLIQSQFAADRFITKNGEQINVKGNRLPYAASILFNHALGYESKNNSGFRLSGNYAGKQFSDELNSIESSADGRTGLIASRYIVDATGYVKLKNKNISFSLSVKNLNNERYIASRRPQGIRVGIGRQFIAGIEIKW